MPRHLLDETHLHPAVTASIAEELMQSGELQKLLG